MVGKIMHKLVATLAIAKADLITTFRNPTSIFFGVLFPLVFIVAFGSIGDGGAEFDIVVSNSTNQENPVVKTLDEIEGFNLQYDDYVNTESDLSKGQLDAYLEIAMLDNGKFEVNLETTSASPQAGPVIRTVVEGVVDKINLSRIDEGQKLASLEITELEGREFKGIDFVLPGMLGFSLMTSGVIGTAFLFVELRENLVIKRFFVTPITKFNIIVGIALSKLVFSMMQAAILVGIGTSVFGFTLIDGFLTLIQIMFLAGIGVFIFLGFGFLVSTIAKDRNAVPPAANLVTLPQFLLAGTLFPIESLPEWLQPVSTYLPLTYLNDAMRQVSFEGVSIFNLQSELLVLAFTAVIVYTVAIKTFKWE